MVDDTALDTSSENTEWSDYGKNLLSKFKDVSASAQSGVAYVADQLGYDDLSKDIEGRAHVTRIDAAHDYSEMTPAAQSAANAGIDTAAFWEHPLRATALQMSGMAPAMLMTALPGGVMAQVAARVGSAGLAAAAGTAGAAAASGALAGGDYANAVASELDGLKDDQLQEQSAYYKGMRLSGVSEEDARHQLRSFVTGPGTMAVNVGIGALAGGISLPGMLSRGAVDDVAGAAAKRFAPEGGLKAAAVGGAAGVAEAAIPEAVQESTADYSAQQGAIDVGNQKEIDWRRVGTSGLGAAFLSAPAGAALGAHGGYKATKVSSEAHPDDAQAAALTGAAVQPNTPPPPAGNAVADTTTEAQTGEEEFQPAGLRGSVTTNPNPTVTPEVAAALKPETKAPDETQTIEAPPPPPDLLSAPEVTPPSNDTGVEPPPPPPEAMEAAPDMESPAEDVGEDATDPTIEPPPPPPPSFDDLRAAFNPTGETGPIDAGVNTPESPETLAVQQQAVAEGRRPAVMYPAGTKSPRLEPGMQRISVNGFRFDIDPSQTSATEIKTALENDTIGQLLGYGPMNKADVAAAIRRGEQPMVATETTPAGVEAKSALTTEPNAQATLEAVQNTAAPDSTVELKPAEAVDNILAQREAAVTPMGNEAPVVDNATPAAQPGPRVLRDVSEEGVLNDLHAADEWANRNAEVNQENKPVTGPTGKNWTKAQIAERQTGNSAAKQIADANVPNAEVEQHYADNKHPSFKSARDAIYARAKAMVDAATAAGLKIPEAWRKNTKGEMEHSPEMKLLSEAQRLIKKKVPSKKDYDDFISREQGLRAGQVEQVTAERKEEGDLAKRADQGDVEAPLGNVSEALADHNTPEAALEAKQDADTADDEPAPVERERPKVELTGHIAIAGKDKAGTFKAEKVKRRTPTKGAATPQKTAPETAEKANPTRDSRKWDWPITEIEKYSGEDYHPKARAIATLRAWAGTLSDAAHAKLEKLGVYDFPRIMAGPSEPDRVLAALVASLRNNEATFLDPGDYSSVVEEVAKELQEKGSYNINPTKPKATVKANPSEVLRRDMGDAGADEAGKPIKVGNAEFTPTHSMELGQILDPAVLRGWAKGRWGGLGRIMLPIVAKRLAQAAGDVKVHFVSTDDAFLKFGMADGGQYLPRDNVILIHDDERTQAPERLQYIALHEAAHAAVAYELANNTRLKHNLEALMKHVKKEMAGQKWRELPLDGYEEKIVSKHYGLDNLDDFVAEALSNPNFQKILASVHIPTEMQKAFGVKAWRIVTAWDALVERIRQSLNLPPNASNALEAVLSVSEDMIERQIERKAAREKEGYPVHLTKYEKMGNEEVLYRKMSDRVTDISNRVRDFTNSTTARSALDKIWTNTQLAYKYKGLFGANEPHLRAAMLREAQARDSDLWLDRSGAKDMISKLDEMRDKYEGAVYDDAINLAFRARVNEVHPYQDNKHLGGNRAIRTTQQRTNEIQIKRDFERLKRSAPDLHAAILEASAFAEKAQNEASLETLRSLLKNAKLDPALAEDIHNDGLTDEQKDKLNSKLVNALDKAREFKKVKGLYLPLKRFGDWVVSGREAFTPPAGAVWVNQSKPDENPVIHFVQRPGESQAALARRYARWAASRPQSQHADLKRATKILVDPTDHSKVIPKEEVGPHAYKVEVDTRHVMFHDSEAAAIKGREEFLANNPGANVAHVELRNLDPNAPSVGMMDQHMAQLEKILQKSDHYRDATDAEKADLMRTLQEATASFRAGTQFSKHMLKAGNVKGYSVDLPRVMADYADKAANYLARIRYKPEIAAALREMRDFKEANKYTDGENATIRSSVMREFDRRMYTDNARIEEGPVHNAVQRLLQLSMLDKLAGISHNLINMTEPTTLSLPVLASRHGLSSSFKAIKSAYSLIGASGALKTGIKDTAAAFRRNDTTTDYLELFKDNIRKSGAKDGARLNDMLNFIQKYGLMDASSEFEVRKILHPDVTRVGKVIDHFDNMFRQVGMAIEGNNRAVTAVAGYRMEFAKLRAEGMGVSEAHQQATDYAYKTVHDTQGNYSASNAAPVFNNSAARIMLQFKKYGQKLYSLMGQQVKGAIAGDREAAKAFMGVMATHALIAGAFGLPLEPIKLAIAAAGGLGLTGLTYEDFEDGVKGMLSDLLGQTASEVITKGVPHLANVDLSGRMGLDSLVLRDMPDMSSKDKFFGWLGKTLGGAVADTVFDTLDNAQKARKAFGEGDMGGVAEGVAGMIPLKAVGDVTKAVTGMAHGKESKRGYEIAPKSGVLEAGINALGFKTASREELDRKRAYIHRNDQRTHAQSEEMKTKWFKASPDERTKMWVNEIVPLNRSLPEGAKITRESLNSYVKHRETLVGKGNVKYGQQVRKTNRSIFDRADAIFGN